MSEQKEFHCWFSKKMCGTMKGEIYYHINGVPTAVTLATTEKNHECTWDDMEYLGVGTFAYNKNLLPQELI